MNLGLATANENLPRGRPWERTLPASSVQACTRFPDTGGTQDACAPRRPLAGSYFQRAAFGHNQRPHRRGAENAEGNGAEKPFQPGKKFKLHSIGDTEAGFSLCLRDSVAKSVRVQPEVEGEKGCVNMNDFFREKVE